MKKLTTILMMIVMLGITIPAMGAMSMSKVRKNTRFLTDRMAYELKLTQNQYDDVYEINYDFVNNVRYIMDDVARGSEYALDKYYDFLDIRNDDLRWILSGSQYRRFMGAEYFFRPIYTVNSSWSFRIYNIYTNINFFYFGKPHHYSSYCGGHYRKHFNNISFYKSRWNKRYNHHDRFDGFCSIRNDKRYDSHRHNDFGVPVRPNTTTRPNTNTRPNNGNRPEMGRPGNGNRPGNNSRPNNGNGRPENSGRPGNNSRPVPETRPNGNGNSSRPSGSGRPSYSSKEYSNGRNSSTRYENRKNDKSRKEVSESRGNDNDNGKRSAKRERSSSDKDRD